MRRAAAVAVALAYACSIEVGTARAYGAEAEVADYLERDWYHVETLFFRHRAPPGDEDFSRQALPRHQPGMAALEPPPAYVAAVPDEPLDFPRLEQFDCIAPALAPWMQPDEPGPPPADDEILEGDPAAMPDETEAGPGERDGGPGERGGGPGEREGGPGEREGRPGETEESASAQPIIAVAPVPTGPPAPSPAERARWAFEAFERGLMLEGWQWRYDGLSLRSAAARMRRAGDYTVLHHGKWLQAVPPRDSARPLLIQLGAPMPDATFELEGSVSVTLGRFLHFAAQVWLRQDPVDARDLPGVEGTAESTGGAETVQAGAKGSGADEPGYVLLSESRRMRPGEVHYLDHPWFGILVRIEPLAAPDALLELAESLADG